MRLKHPNIWVNSAVFSISFVLFLHAIEDPDIWFHMTIGRAILEHGMVPSEEFYVFTRLGEASEFHEWGFGLLYHLANSLFGLNGIIILNALVGALTVFLLYLTVRNQNNSIIISLCAVLVSFWLLEFRFVQRPENFLYLAIISTIYLVNCYRQRSDWRYLSAIPIIGLTLSQIHPSVIMLGLVVGTYCAEAILQKNPDLKQTYQLGLTIIATLLLSLFNPYGLDQLILPIKFSLQNEFLQSFNEFLPALSTPYGYRFIIALLIAAISLGGVRKRFSLAEWIMVIAFSYLAYQHVRDIALLGIALAMPFATALSANIKPPMLARGIALCILCFVVVDSTRFHRMKFDIDPVMAPVAGAELIEKYSQSENILNFYHLGNYLAWRLGSTHKVIIDGRNFQDNKSLALHDSLLSANRGWQNTLLQYDIDAVVTPATLPYSGNFIPLVFELARNPQWVLISREPAGVVFIRRDRVPNNVPTLSENDLWQQAKDELESNLSYYPDSESSQKSLDRVNSYLGNL